MLKKIKHHWITDTLTGQNAPVTRSSPAIPAAVLLGAPDDRGVLNVGGRLGAGHGPQALREMLGQFMLGMEGSVGRVELHRGWDIEPGATIEAAHVTLRKSVADCIDAGVTPVVIGGGHDFGYPHVAGCSDALKGKVSLINVDAHLDVRPPTAEGITSGSPFYLALEEGVIRPRNFVEFGIQEHCNDESYLGYLQRKGVRIVMLDDARRGTGAVQSFRKLIMASARAGLKTVVSFDVDAVQMAYAPGVSAPQVDGFTPDEFLQMARICGESPNVVSVGFFELAPSLDESQRTVRLVATAVHRFLSGLSARGAAAPRKKNRVRRLLRRAGLKR